MLNKPKRWDEFHDESQCPDCGSSSLVLHIDLENYEYNYETYEFETHRQSCNNCGKEIVNHEDREKQEKRVEKRLADGFLTDLDIKRIREKLGLTQAQLARKLGVSKKTFARYENLSVRQSRSMDRLLRILDKYPSLLVEISKKPQNTSEVTHSSNISKNTDYPIKHQGYTFQKMDSTETD